MKNQFQRKADAATYCSQYCPKPYDERAAAVWVADQMNTRGQRGQMRDYDFIQAWAVSKSIDYDVAYCWEWHHR